MAHFTKTPKADKTPYTFHCIHTDNERPWGNYKYLQWVGIDPGNRNLGIRVEKKFRDGTVEMVAMGKYQLAPDQERDGVTCRSASLNLTQLFELYQHHFFASHIIVIERQLPENLKATRIAQFMIMYFTILLKNSALRPLLLEVDPKLKFRILGAPKGINKAQQKIWISDFMWDLYVFRGDTSSLQIMKQAKGKRDELAEPGAIIESLSIHMGLGMSIGVTAMMEKHKNWVPASSRPVRVIPPQNPPRRPILIVE